MGKWRENRLLSMVLRYNRCWVARRLFYQLISLLIIFLAIEIVSLLRIHWQTGHSFLVYNFRALRAWIYWFVDCFPLFCSSEAPRCSFWWGWRTVWLEDELELVCPRICGCWCRDSGWVLFLHTVHGCMTSRAQCREEVLDENDTGIVTCQG